MIRNSLNYDKNTAKAAIKLSLKRLCHGHDFESNPLKCAQTSLSPLLHAVQGRQMLSSVFLDTFMVMFA